MNTPKERCFASKARGTVIDVLNPFSGLTACFGKTLADVRKEYPDAEEMLLEDWCAWKAAQQRTPITWQPTTPERYEYALNAVPPEVMWRGWFLMGEPENHDAGNGQPRSYAYRNGLGGFEVSSRPMTRSEFLSELATAGLNGCDAL
jgi:hypothetical protein